MRKLQFNEKVPTATCAANEDNLWFCMWSRHPRCSSRKCGTYTSCVKCYKRTSYLQAISSTRATLFFVLVVELSHSLILGYKIAT